MATVVAIMGRHSANPSKEHHEAIDHALRWCVGRQSFGITYGGHSRTHGSGGDLEGPLIDVRHQRPTLEIYADAEFATQDEDHRRSSKASS